MMRARNLSFAASRFGCPCAQMLAGTVPFMPFVAERRVVWVTPVPHRVTVAPREGFVTLGDSLAFHGPRSAELVAYPGLWPNVAAW